MYKVSFDKIAFFYNFAVKYLAKDYKSSIQLIDKYLQLSINHCVIDIGGGTGLYSNIIIRSLFHNELFYICIIIMFHFYEINASI